MWLLFESHSVGIAAMIAESVSLMIGSSLTPMPIFCSIGRRGFNQVSSLSVFEIYHYAITPYLNNTIS